MKDNQLKWLVSLDKWPLRRWLQRNSRCQRSSGEGYLHHESFFLLNISAHISLSAAFVPVQMWVLDAKRCRTKKKIQSVIARLSIYVSPFSLLMFHLLFLLCQKVFSFKGCFQCACVFVCWDILSTSNVFKVSCKSVVRGLEGNARRSWGMDQATPADLFPLSSCYRN